jgi:hypothetical protein
MEWMDRPALSKALQNWEARRLQSGFNTTIKGQREAFIDGANAANKHRWNSAEIKPPHNVGVLVFIPDEDNHITSGMWDISNKWVLLDEYRTPECEVTHWMPLPNPPATTQPKTIKE